MARESRFIEGVWFLENEEEGYEYLTFPRTDFMWDRKLNLGEGDALIRYCLQWFGEELTKSWVFLHDREKLNTMLDDFRAQFVPEQERLLVRRDPDDGELVALPESEARRLDGDPEAELHAVEDQVAPEEELEEIPF